MKLNNDDNDGKIFELEQNSKTEKMTENEIYELLLPGGFTNMLMRMKVGESMFHYDTMTNFTRVK